MSTTTDMNANPWRIAGWSLLAALFALPAVAMRFTTEVDWTPFDFVAAALLLGALGVGFEVIARTRAVRWLRVVMAVALIVLFLLVWVELAVGIIGE